MKDKIGGALSAQAFKHLVDQRGTDLAIAGIAATVGHTSGGPKNPGPTWISLISHRAYGRLIRGPDGSYESSAYRRSDGEQLLATNGDAVSPTHLDDLIDAVGRI